MSLFKITPLLHWPTCQRNACVTFVILFLGACASTPDSIQTLDNPQWHITGKIGIKQESTRSGSSFFDWKQQQDLYQIYLYNLLGQTQFIIDGNSISARLYQNDGTILEANTPEKLLKEITGWHFPVRAVANWLNGQTSQKDKDINRDNDGNLRSLVNGQWAIEFDRYKTIEEKILPHKIKLQKEDLKVTLIIKEYGTVKH